MPGAQLVLFFTQAYCEKEGEPEEQLRLLELLTTHRPELEQEAAERIVHGH